MIDLTEEQQARFRGGGVPPPGRASARANDVQNIDLMNLAGFCRNCLSNWYRDAANAEGVDMDKDESREIIYGMPYAEWRAQHQKEASPDKQAAFEVNRPEAALNHPHFSHRARGPA
jgi:uncharacterized protein